MEDKHIKPLFPVWCHKILPLVYDESLSYYEVLCKVQSKLNEVINSQNNLQDEFYQLKDWIDSQLKSYSKEQLQEWLDDGTLENLINQVLFISKVTKYKNVEEMKKDNGLINGNICVTSGYYTINDGGNGLYYITNKKDDSKWQEILENGLYATLINDITNVLCYGIDKTGTNDDTELFRKIIEITDNVYIPQNTIINISNNITINKKVWLHGSGTTSIIKSNNFDTNFIISGGGFNDDVLSTYENFKLVNIGFSVGSNESYFANGIVFKRLWAFGNNSKDFFVKIRYNSWLIDFSNCIIQNFINGIYIDFNGGFKNSGACISTTNTYIYNCGQNGVLIESVTQDGYDIYFTNSDFEHCGQYGLCIRNGKGGNIQLSSWHSESNGIGAIYNDGANIWWRGGWANVFNEDNCFIITNVSGQVTCDHVRLLLLSKRGFKIDGGYIDIKNTCVYPTDLFTNYFGTLETSSTLPFFDSVTYEKPSGAILFIPKGVKLKGYYCKLSGYFTHKSGNVEIVAQISKTSGIVYNNIQVNASNSGSGFYSVECINGYVITTFIIENKTYQKVIEITNDENIAINTSISNGSLEKTIVNRKYEKCY